MAAEQLLGLDCDAAAERLRLEGIEERENKTEIYLRNNDAVGRRGQEAATVARLLVLRVLSYAPSAFDNYGGGPGCVLRFISRAASGL